MAEEQKQAPAPGGAPRREGGHGGGHAVRAAGTVVTAGEGGPGGGGPGGPGAGLGQAPVFPEEEGVQVLRREMTSSTTSARHPVAVRAGAREDSAAADDGRVRASSALARVAIKRARNIALLPFAAARRARRHRA